MALVYPKNKNDQRCLGWSTPSLSGDCSFIEAFANVYLAAAKAIGDQITGNPAPADGYDFPNADDGVAGLAFIETAVKSSSSSEKWVKFPDV